VKRSVCPSPRSAYHSPVRRFPRILSRRPAFLPAFSALQRVVEAEGSALQYDPSRRERVGAILQRQNQACGCSPQTFANITRLRQGAAAVVTGQQVGLFGGPMFAIYKALTAVKLAEEATAAASTRCPSSGWHIRPRSRRGESRFVARPDGLLRTLTTSSHGVAARR